MVTRRTAIAVALALALIGLAAAAVPGSPAAVSAATPWSIRFSPAVLTRGVATDVTVTLTPGNNHIGLLQLDVPAGFTVVSTRVSSALAGSGWTSAQVGSGPTQITFSTTTDPWRLDQGVDGVFVVRVVATASPLAAWKAVAYEKFTTTSKLANGPLLPPAAFVSGPPLTLTPTPTPRPTQLPTVGPPGTSPAPTPSDSTIPSETPSTFASAGPIAGGAAGGSSGVSGGVAPKGVEGPPLDVGALGAGGTVQVDVQAVGAIGMFAWLVPGLFLSLPGLLLLLIVLVQASFATAFVPVVRRVIGLNRKRRTRDPRTSPG